MSKHKHIDAICIGITVFTLLVTLLFMNGKALGITVVASEENNDEMFTENDLDDAWDTENATRIVLSDEGSTVKGNGAYVNNGDIYIVYSGKYVLSGELSNGSVIVKANGNDKIWLKFSGVSIHCEDNAAIHVEQADKVFMTLQDGTENTLSSGTSFGEEAVSAGVDGTIYSRDDLTINGTGSLQVMAKYRHGIVCNDDFVMTGGTLDITAAQDAVHANDSVRLKDASLTLSAGDDGITASNDDETSFLYVESGNICIPSCCEGLEAVQITIAGGTFDIRPTDDGLNANGYSGNSVITITGGEITVVIENGQDADGIDSNKDIYISGGRLIVSVSDNGGSCAIDCGSENGGVCEITGGTVLACGSSRMAEGFDTSSSQGFLMQNVSAEAGTTAKIKDANGNELISEVVPCGFSSILVSTPEMKVGDICTLVIGDTETEVTIDNSSGFGGEKMSGRGGYGRNGGMKSPEMFSRTDGMTPLNMTQNGAEGGIQSDLPQENMSDLPQNEDNSNGMQYNSPQNGRNFNGRQDGDNMRAPNGKMPGQDNTSQPKVSETQISMKAIVLLIISAIVLLAGCIVAACYKRRG